MDRLILLVFACTAQVGCHAPTPSFDPFALYGQTRVPPPPTGAVGRPDGYYRPQTSAPALTTPPQGPPPLNQGTSYSPESQPAPAQTRTPWRSVTPAASTARQPSNKIDPQTVPLGSNGQTQYNDRLSWVNPSSRYTVATTSGVTPVAAAPPAPASSGVVVVTDPLNPYAQVDACCLPEAVVHGVPVPIPQSVTIPPTEQIVSYGTPYVVGNPTYPVSPPRIRGFVNSGMQSVRIPAGLSVVSDQVVHTADANWKSRDANSRPDGRY